MSEGQRLLDEAEAKDHYLAACNASARNASSREGNHYKPHFLPHADAQRLRGCVYRTEILNGADIVVLHPSADNGFPHTRPDKIVCVPSSCVTKSSTVELEETMRHEAMHINQRAYPHLWKEKCIREGWSEFPLTEIPSRLLERCRINPDTMYDAPFWAWEGTSVPLPLFKRDTLSVDLGDVSIEWLDLRTFSLFHSPPQSFVKRYGSASQPEHPYEVLAVEYAKAGVSKYSILERILKA
jgi:hypothetical protein